MVKLVTTSFTQYTQLLAQSTTRDQQLNIVRAVMDALYARNRKIITFQASGTTYNVVDVLEGFGYRDANHNFVRTLLDSKTPPARVELITHALLALGNLVKQEPLLASGINDAMTFYVPAGQDDVPNIRFFEVGVTTDEFTAQIPSIRKALVLLSKVFAAAPQLHRSKVRFTTSDSVMNKLLPYRRGDTFGAAWKSLVTYINYFTADNKGQWREEFQQLMIFGQKETDRYLAAQKLLLQILNKALASESLRARIQPVIAEFANDWPLHGSFTRAGILYLPLDLLDKDDVRAYKLAYGKQLRTILEGAKTRIPRDKRQDFNTIINEFKITLSGALDYEENRRRFWHAVRALGQLVPAEGKNVERLAATAGIVPVA